MEAALKPRKFTRSKTSGSLGVLFRSDRGQSLIELAFLTPVLLILVVGIVEMGRYASLDILVGNAAKAGAEYGAQSLANASSVTGITCAAENESLNGVPTCPSTNPLNLTVTPATVCGCDNAGTITAMATCTSTCANHVVVSVQVNARGTFNPLFSYATPLFGKLKINAITLSSTATQRVSQ